MFMAGLAANIGAEMAQNNNANNNNDNPPRHDDSGDDADFMEIADIELPVNNNNMNNNANPNSPANNNNNNNINTLLQTLGEPKLIYMLCCLTLLLASLSTILVSPIYTNNPHYPLWSGHVWSLLLENKFFQGSVFNLFGFLTLYLREKLEAYMLCTNADGSQSKEYYSYVTSYLIFKFLITSQYRGSSDAGNSNLVYGVFFGSLAGENVETVGAKVICEEVDGMKGRGGDPFKVKIERGWIVLGVALTLLKSVHAIFCGGLKLTTLLGCEIMIVAVELLETMVKASEDAGEKWQDEIDELLEEIATESKKAGDHTRYLRLAKSVLLFFSYLHLWISIGFDYSFFDGLLVLSVRSCVYEFCETALEWARECEIAGQMEESFEKPTREELTNLKNTSEVCCICLKGFGHKGNNVRKIQCGHFFHMSCLTEVLKRASGTTKAKCPICRQPALKGSEKEDEEGAAASAAAVPQRAQNNAAVVVQNAQDVAPPPPPPPAQPAQPPLFRFSTESFPAWFPQFFFEVVQRPQPQQLLPHNDQVNFVSDMFPGVERTRIEGMLNGRNADEVVNMLLGE
ncbi:hypothetical protein TL16_g02836 [Triparma laevis f. inornata]|uniref:RING-type domain-containing protein n=1 Tax=Triparma laevis f. inornata TaxID=1714386 RepID=A0A9W7DZ78_9STRA|nr:hypothetical protein TL16_g02836 [Triparma laevis f. inornata]